MAKKKEATTEEEMIAELQKQIDAYNKKIGNTGKARPTPVPVSGKPKRPKPGTTTLVSPGGGKKYIPRTPVKTPKPGDGMKYIPRTPGKK
jgi:hypothetical protein